MRSGVECRDDALPELVALAGTVAMVECQAVEESAITRLEASRDLIFRPDDGERFEHDIGDLASHTLPIPRRCLLRQDGADVTPAMDVQDRSVIAGRGIEGDLLLDGSF